MPQTSQPASLQTLLNAEHRYLASTASYSWWTVLPCLPRAGPVPISLEDQRWLCATAWNGICIHAVPKSVGENCMQGGLWASLQNQFPFCKAGTDLKLEHQVRPENFEQSPVAKAVPCTHITPASSRVRLPECNAKFTMAPCACLERDAEMPKWLFRGSLQGSAILQPTQQL